MQGSSGTCPTHSIGRKDGNVWKTGRKNHMLGHTSLDPIRERRMESINDADTKQFNLGVDAFSAATRTSQPATEVAARDVDGSSPATVGLCTRTWRVLRDWFKDRWLQRSNHYYGQGGDEYFRIEYKKDWERLRGLGRHDLPDYTRRW